MPELHISILIEHFSVLVEWCIHWYNYGKIPIFHFNDNYFIYQKSQIYIADCTLCYDSVKDIKDDAVDMYHCFEYNNVFDSEREDSFFSLDQ